MENKEYKFPNGTEQMHREKRAVPVRMAVEGVLGNGPSQG